MVDENEGKIIIDWLSFRTCLHTPFQIMELLGLQEMQTKFQEIYGFYGYRKRLYFDGISIHYDSSGQNAGVLLELSGEGCRSFETYGHGDYNVLYDIVLREPKATKITRFDVAYDYFGKDIEINRICKDTIKGYYISKFENTEVIYSNKGNSINLGSPKSDVMMRIYDKLSERINKVKNEKDKQIISENIPHWLRFELQMRDDHAFKFVKELQFKKIGELYAGVLKNYINYGRMTQKNGRLEFSTFKYWQKLVSGSEKISLYTAAGTDYNLKTLCDYVVNQAGNAVDALIKIYGIKNFKSMIENRDIINKPKYIELIKKYERKNNESVSIGNN